jgi:LDH2 family malate/lactate/ureidoglycolate dehydrogenase
MACVAIGELQASMLERARSMGMAEADAELVVDHFLDAELRGAAGHGVERLRWLAGRGPSARGGGLRLAERQDGMARYDGSGALGYMALRRALDAELARPPSGARVVVVSHCFPTGRLGYYAERVAEHGFVCLLTATSTARIMHPAGGPPVLGTNPFCLAVPDPAGPAVIDVSMGTVTYGAVLKAAADGRPLPEGAAADAAGLPSTDPEAVTAGDAGILPFGGPQAYKAFGLALAAELLCTSLAGLDGHSAVALMARPASAPAHLMRAALEGRRFPGDASRATLEAAHARGTVEVADDLWAWLGG